MQLPPGDMAERRWVTWASLSPGSLQAESPPPPRTNCAQERQDIDRGPESPTPFSMVPML